MAKGFSNVPAPSHEFRSASSWGRTRGPKNLAGTNGTQVSAATAPPTSVTNGYATENQRYLHLRFKESQNTSRTITVWAWSHAFGAWSALTDLTGTAVTLTCDAETKYRVFEISGVDRVYFQASGALHGSDELHAAGSTF
jgi:hypothetical protein